MVAKKPARERRTIMIVVRLNKAERAELKALAKRTGEREAELIRRLVKEEGERCRVT